MKKLKFCIVSFLLVLTGGIFSACGTQSISNLQFQNETLYMQIGQMVQLELSTTDDIEIDIDSLKITSSQPDVVYVGPDLKILALSAGTSIISATTSGGVSTQVVVQVEAEAHVLDYPVGLRYDDESNSIRWNAVQGANGYTININGEERKTANTYWSVDEQAVGVVQKVKVKANSNIAINSSEYSPEYTFTVLSTPTNLRFAKTSEKGSNVITWDGNSDKYSVCVNNVRYQETANKYFVLNLDEATTYEIFVIAVSNQQNVFNSQKSESISVSRLANVSNIVWDSATSKLSWGVVGVPENQVIYDVVFKNRLGETKHEVSSVLNSITINEDVLPRNTYSVSIFAKSNKPNTLNNLSASVIGNIRITDILPTPTLSDFSISLNSIQITDFGEAENFDFYINEIPVRTQISIMGAMATAVFEEYTFIDAGEYHITCKSQANQANFFDESLSSDETIVTRLSAPKNISVLNTGNLTFDLVDGASNYAIKIGEVTLNNDRPTFEIFDMIVSNEQSVEVQSLGDNELIFDSAKTTFVVKKLSTPTLSFNKEYGELTINGTPNHAFSLTINGIINVFTSSPVNIKSNLSVGNNSVMVQSIGKENEISSNVSSALEIKLLESVQNVVHSLSSTGYSLLTFDQSQFANSYTVIVSNPNSAYSYSINNVELPDGKVQLISNILASQMFDGTINKNYTISIIANSLEDNVCYSTATSIGVSTILPFSISDITFNESTKTFSWPSAGDGYSYDYSIVTPEEIITEFNTFQANAVLATLPIGEYKIKVKKNTNNNSKMSFYFSAEKTFIVNHYIPQSVAQFNKAENKITILNSDSYVGKYLIKITSGDNVFTDEIAKSANSLQYSLAGKLLAGLNNIEISTYKTDSAGQYVIEPTKVTMSISKLPVVTSVSYRNNNATLEWPAISGAVSYIIKIDGGANITVNTNNYNTNNGLKADLHTINIKAVSLNADTNIVDGEFSDDLTFEVFRKLNAPTNLDFTYVSGEDEKIVLKFNGDSRANLYKIYINGHLIGSIIYSSYSDETISCEYEIKDVLLEALKTVGNYSLCVVSSYDYPLNDARYLSDSGISNVVTITKLPKPALVRVDFNEFINVTGINPTDYYDLKVYINDSETPFDYLNTNLNDFNGTINIKARYESNDKAYFSSEYTEIIYTRLPTPINLQLNYGEDDLASITCDNYAEYAEDVYYSFYLKHSTSSSWTVIDSETNIIEATSISNLLNLSCEYNVAVKLNKLDESPMFYLNSKASDVVSFYKLSAPTNLNCSASDETTITLSWDTIESERSLIAEFKIYRDNSLFGSATSEASSFIINKSLLTTAKNHVFYICAIGKAKSGETQDSFNSVKSANIRVQKLSAPSSIRVNAQEKIEVPNSGSPANYVLKIYVNDVLFEDYNTSNLNAYDGAITIKARYENITHSYITGEFNQVVYNRILTPTNLQPVYTNDVFTSIMCDDLSLDGKIDYMFEIKRPGSNVFEPLTAQTQNSIPAYNLGVSNSGIYSIRVKANKKSGTQDNLLNSYYSDEFSFYKISTPTNAIVTENALDDTKLDFTWEVVDAEKKYISGYNIYRRDEYITTIVGCDNLVYTFNKSSIVNSGDYNFRVSAIYKLKTEETVDSVNSDRSENVINANVIKITPVSFVLNNISDGIISWTPANESNVVYKLKIDKQVASEWQPLLPLTDVLTNNYNFYSLLESYTGNLKFTIYVVKDGDRYLDSISTEQEVVRLNKPILLSNCFGFVVDNFSDEITTNYSLSLEGEQLVSGSGSGYDIANDINFYSYFGEFKFVAHNTQVNCVKSEESTLLTTRLSPATGMQFVRGSSDKTSLEYHKIYLQWNSSPESTVLYNVFYGQTQFDISNRTDTIALLPNEIPEGNVSFYLFIAKEGFIDSPVVSTTITKLSNNLQPSITNGEFLFVNSEKITANYRIEYQTGVGGDIEYFASDIENTQAGQLGYKFTNFDGNITAQIIAEGDLITCLDSNSCTFMVEKATQPIISSVVNGIINYIAKTGTYDEEVQLMYVLNGVKYPFTEEGYLELNTAMSPETTYALQICATKNNALNSDYSESINVRKILPYDNTKFYLTTSNNNITTTLNWSTNYENCDKVYNLKIYKRSGDGAYTQFFSKTYTNENQLVINTEIYPAGEYKAVIQASGSSDLVNSEFYYIQSVYSDAIEFIVLPTLDADSVRVNNGILKWEPLKNALNYAIYFDGEEGIKHLTDLCEYDFSNVLIGTGNIIKNIKIKAVADGINYLASYYSENKLICKPKSPTTLSVEDGALIWKGTETNTFCDQIVEESTYIHENQVITLQFTSLTDPTFVVETNMLASALINTKIEEKLASGFSHCTPAPNDNYYLQKFTYKSSNGEEVLLPSGDYLVKVKQEGDNTIFITSEYSSAFNVTIMPNITNLKVLNHELVWDEVENIYSGMSNIVYVIYAFDEQVDDWVYLKEVSEDVNGLGLRITGFSLQNDGGATNPLIKTSYTKLGVAVKGISAPTTNNYITGNMEALNITVLGQVEDVQTINGALSWKNVDNKVKFVINISGTVIESDNNTPDAEGMVSTLLNSVDSITWGEELNITIAARGNENSVLGETYKVNGLPSVNSKFVKIATPVLTLIDEGGTQDGLLRWAVDNNAKIANGYVLDVYYDGETQQTFNYSSGDIELLSHIIQEIKCYTLGEVKLMLRAIGNSSMPVGDTPAYITSCDKQVDCTIVSVPQNVRIEDDMLKWTMSSDASGYYIDIYNQDDSEFVERIRVEQSSQFNLSQRITAGVAYKVSMISLGEPTEQILNSSSSVILENVVALNQPANVQITNDGYLSWDKDIFVEKYHIECKDLNDNLHTYDNVLVSDLIATEESYIWNHKDLPAGNYKSISIIAKGNGKIQSNKSVIKNLTKISSIQLNEIYLDTLNGETRIAINKSFDTLGKENLLIECILNDDGVIETGVFASMVNEENETIYLNITDQVLSANIQQISIRVKYNNISTTNVLGSNWSEQKTVCQVQPVVIGFDETNQSISWEPNGIVEKYMVYNIVGGAYELLAEINFDTNKTLYTFELFSAGTYNLLVRSFVSGISVEENSFGIADSNLLENKEFNLFASGTGISSDPYQVNVLNIYNIALRPSAYYILIEDIVLTRPVGYDEDLTEYVSFTGSFNGNEKHITLSFIYNIDKQTNFGAFAKIDNFARVENLNVILSPDISISAPNGTYIQFGGITAIMVKGTISNCTVSGTMSIKTSDFKANLMYGDTNIPSFGGIVVTNGSQYDISGTNAQINNCSVNGQTDINYICVNNNGTIS